MPEHSSEIKHILGTVYSKEFLFSVYKLPGYFGLNSTVQVK